MDGEKPPWRILEFYSGIGGMRYSLARAAVRGEVVEAFDINDSANDVYQHNFRHRPFQGNIQSLSSEELDKYGANAWLMSPPCQPYTRQGLPSLSLSPLLSLEFHIFLNQIENHPKPVIHPPEFLRGLQKHSADARASSFIKILELVPLMQQPPTILFVENVVGFERSDTHDHLIDILTKSGFTTQECILSPLQFGIPYSRPRYFCMAKRKPLSFQNAQLNGQLLLTPSPFLRETAADPSCQPIKNFLEVNASSFPPPKSNLPGQPSDEDTNELEERENLHSVPRGLIERWGASMDVVFPDSIRCCCFTKSYYRYVKGTGSLLATVQPVNQDELSLRDLGLRYFTPREVANLHSFPENFDFPAHVSLRQRYALLGNSLSVAVVGPLLEYLFADPL